jgi:multiple sugar transport system permease protein
VTTLERNRRPLRPARVVLHGFLIATALAWLAPLLWTVYISLRPYSETGVRGRAFALPEVLNFDNYVAAWQQADLPRYYLNTFLITVPSLALTLLGSSMVAFVIARHRPRWSKLMLIVFTAGNLLPFQILLVPLYRVYIFTELPQWMSDSGYVYDSYWGVIAVHIAFQTGFCTFVLTNYMQTLPHELTEAAQVDGAGVWRQYWQLTMPLCRPVIAALATLEFTWIYNDFLWALMLMSTGEKRPIVSALANLKGQFVADENLLAAGSLLAALPTLIVYFALQKQFIGGLTLGANKG